MAERKTTKEIVLNDKDEPTGEIKWTFSDGSTETFNVASVNDTIKGRLALHGASQKIGDSYAGAASSPDPLAYAKAAVKETIAQLYAGEWRATVSAGPKVNDLAIAISRATGESLDDSIELVDAMTDDDKKVWRGKAKIKLELAKLVQERNAAKIAKLAEAAAKEEAAAAPQPA